MEETQRAPRILFVHVSRDASTEYDIHRTLAAHAPDVVARWCWQRSAHWNDTSPDAVADRDRFVDAGRDLSTRTSSRSARAALMVRRFLPTLQWLVRQVREFRPDALYVCQHDQELLLALLVRRITRTRVIVHVNYPIGPWSSRTVRTLLARADGLVACTEFVKGTIVDDGIAATRVTVVPNPVPSAGRGAAPAPVDGLREQLGMSDATKLVVSVGRLDRVKGHDELIEAFALLADRHPDVAVVICGRPFADASYAARLEERVAQLGLAQRVRFLGQRSDAVAVVAAGDVFCLPTQLEAFGLVFAEAMAVGKPVVAYRSGGVPEIVVDEETGLLVPPHDVPALAGALERLIDDPELAQRMGDAGRRRAQRLYDPEVVAPRWSALVARLAQS